MSRQRIAASRARSEQDELRHRVWRRPERLRRLRRTPLEALKGRLLRRSEQAGAALCRVPGGAPLRSERRSPPLRRRPVAAPIRATTGFCGPRRSMPSRRAPPARRSAPSRRSTTAAGGRARTRACARRRPRPAIAAAQGAMPRPSRTAVRSERRTARSIARARPDARQEEPGMRAMTARMACPHSRTQRRGSARTR